MLTVWHSELIVLSLVSIMGKFLNSDSIIDFKKLIFFGMIMESISYSEFNIDKLRNIIDFPNRYNEQFEGLVLVLSISSSSSLWSINE